MKRKAHQCSALRDICRSSLAAAAALALAPVAAGCAGSERASPSAINPHPVHLVRPAGRPLSSLARIGRELFFDPRLSGSGKLSCATCHDPTRAYGRPAGTTLRLPGAAGRRDPARAIPSLRYTDRTPPFAIGPDREDAGVPVMRSILRPPRKIAEAATMPPLVPRGGLFWDGRAGSFEEQALSPLMNPLEMANTGVADVSARLRRFGYATRLAAAVGAPLTAGTGQPSMLDEALFAIGRFEVEDPSFHPYSSRYDRWLEGQERLTGAELRGLRVFEDPAKGNCAACHLDRPGPDGLPPAFTDWQYEALGVPRNPRIPANDDPRYFDLGLGGPVRKDLARSPQWCGMFRTPSLRNIVLRGAYFHNGVYRTLDDVLNFYNLRDTHPDRIYPSERGEVRVFDDLPPWAVQNVDRADAPFDRRRGDPSPMSVQDIQDVLSFLRTLTDADCANPMTSRDSGG